CQSKAICRGLRLIVRQAGSSGGKAHHRCVWRTPRKRTKRGGNVGALAESVGLENKSVSLGNAVGGQRILRGGRADDDFVHMLVYVNRGRGATYPLRHCGNLRRSGLSRGANLRIAQ